MAAAQEKRQWLRVEKRIKVNAIIIDPAQTDSLFKLDPIWTKDVGGNGLGLITNARCMVGLAIDLHFQLPGLKDPIEAKGRVVWSMLEDETKNEYRIGVAFDKINEIDRKAIVRYVESEAKKVLKR